MAARFAVTVPHRHRLTRNLKLHLATKAAARVNRFIAHGSLLFVVRGTDAVPTAQPHTLLSRNFDCQIRYLNRPETATSGAKSIPAFSGIIISLKPNRRRW